MTNTVWQQSSKTRGVPHLAVGTAGYVDDQTPDYTLPYEDDYARQIQETNIPPLVPQQSPVNDIGGIPAYLTPAAPDDFLPDSTIPPPGTAIAPMPAPQQPSAFAGVPAVRGPFAPAPGSEDYTAAQAKLKAINEQYPTLTAPKWWQRAIAGGLGAVAGYSNAASRTRNPVDIRSLQESVEHPAYGEKLEEWRSRAIPAQAQVQLEGERLGAQVKQQQLQNETSLKNAQAYQALQHGEYWLKRSEQERAQWKIDPKTGIIWNTISGQRVAAAPTTKDRYDTAIALHATPEEALQYSLNGKITATGEHNPNQWATYMAAYKDPKAALDAINNDKIRVAKEERKAANPELQDALLQERNDRIERMKNEDLDKVANKKNADERAIMDRHRIELSGLNSPNVVLTPEAKIQQTDAINGKYASQLQNVQDEFARQARRRGVDAEDFDVKANPATHKIEYTPRGTKQQSATPVPTTSAPPVAAPTAAPVTPPPVPAARPAVAPSPATAAPGTIPPGQRPRKYNHATNQVAEFDGQQWLVLPQ